MTKLPTVTFAQLTQYKQRHGLPGDIRQVDLYGDNLHQEDKEYALTEAGVTHTPDTFRRLYAAYNLGQCFVNEGLTTALFDLEGFDLDMDAFKKGILFMTGFTSVELEEVIKNEGFIFKKPRRYLQVTAR